jgi:hypothetical protein
MKLVTKVTMKSCGFTTRTCEDLVKNGNAVDILAVVAQISDFKIINGDGEMPDSVQFAGHFLAQNLISNEELRGGKMFLPKIAEEYVFTALQHAKQTDPLSTITVRVIITAEPHTSAKGGFSFKYGAKPFDEPQADDLSKLLAEMTSNQPVKQIASKVKGKK